MKALLYMFLILFLLGSRSQKSLYLKLMCSSLGIHHRVKVAKPCKNIDLIHTQSMAMRCRPILPPLHCPVADPQRRVVLLLLTRGSLNWSSP